jgi:hypothetical protein
LSTQAGVFFLEVIASPRRIRQIVEVAGDVLVAAACSTSEKVGRACALETHWCGGYDHH